MFRQILKYSFAVLIVFSTIFSSSALTLDEARELYKAGKYKEAAPVFKAQLKRRPNDGSLNHWYGVCLFHEKKYNEAEKYLKIGAKRKVLESPHYLADMYMAQYRFEDAISSYEEYTAALSKAKKQIPDSIGKAIARARRAKLMLQYVERVQIIDSLIVDADSFFKYFKMSPESGRIGTNETLGIDIPENTIGYIPQRGDNVFFGYPLEGKGYELCTKNKLIEGKWSDIIPLPNGVNTEQDEAYPFFLNDGVTLYFASNGEGSIGGYDIFITRLNLENNTYLKPENVGMPFNSIYNDYMMAIDEMLNIGWFVSDREQIPGKVTIYLFIPNESKQTYNIDEIKTDIKSLALIRSIRESWPENADYTDLLQQLDNIKEPKKRLAPISSLQFVTESIILNWTNSSVLKLAIYM